MVEPPRCSPSRRARFPADSIYSQLFHRDRFWRTPSAILAGDPPPPPAPTMVAQPECLPLPPLRHSQPSQPPQPLPAGAYRLQTSPLRGYAYHGDPVHLHSLRIGDELTLCAEPANPHDKYAVRVHHRDRHIGYLPGASNHIVSRLLRQGAPLRAIVAWIDPGSNLHLPLTLHVLWDEASRTP